MLVVALIVIGLAVFFVLVYAFVMRGGFSLRGRQPSADRSFDHRVDGDEPPFD